MTQEEFWDLSVTYYEAAQAFYTASQERLQSIDAQLEVLCNLGMAGLVVALGACFYYLFWMRRR